MRVFLAALLSLSPLLGPSGGSSQGTLVVLNKSDATVSLLDGTSGELLSTQPVGAGTHEAATSPDGSRVVVCNYGESKPGSTLTLIDVTERKVTGTIDLGEYQRPHGVVFRPGSEELLVTAEAQRKLLVVDLRRRAVTAAIDIGQEISHMVAVSADGARAFVANIGSGSVSVVDLVERRHLRDVPTGAGAEGIAVRPVSGEVWVTNREANTISILNADASAIEETLLCGAFPIRVAFTPDGSKALVSCAKDDRVEVYDARERSKLADVSMTAKSVSPSEREERIFGAESAAQAMPIGVLVRPDGAVAYVANTMADVVTVIDLERLVVLRRFSAGRQPDGMAWVPARTAGRD